ncbi:MAG: hypothetical protein AAB425_08375, partial [Bdellovibrionota bacterium]
KVSLSDELRRFLKDWPATRILECMVALVCVVFAMGLALLLRSAHWQDPQTLAGATSIWAEAGVNGIRQLFLHNQNQPILGPILRHFFWYPLIGDRTEIVHRLPGLAYDLGAVALAYALGHAVFRDRSAWLRAWIGLAAALSVATNLSEATAANNWTDLTLAALTLFGFLYLLSFKPDRISPNWLGVSVFLAIMSNFLSAITVLPLAVLHLWELQKGGQVDKAKKLFTVLGLGFALALPICLGNMVSIGEKLVFSLSGLYPLLTKLFATPFCWLFFGIALVLHGFRLVAVERLHRAALLMLIALIALCTFVDMRNSIPVLVAPALFIQVVILKDLCDFLSRKRLVSAPILALAGAMLFVSPGLPGSIIDAKRSFNRPEKYFTDVFFDFHWIRMSHRPVLFVLMDDREFPLTDLYLRRIDRAYTGAYLIARHPNRGEATLFLKKHPRALVIVQAGIDATALAPSNDKNLKILPAINALAVDEVSSLDQLVSIANSVGIKLKLDVFAEEVSNSGGG